MFVGDRNLGTMIRRKRDLASGVDPRYIARSQDLDQFMLHVSESLSAI